MEAVPRPTLTPRDKTVNYTENELPASFSRKHAEIIPQFRWLWLARQERPENVGAVVVVRLLAIYGGSVLLCCSAGSG